MSQPSPPQSSTSRGSATMWLIDIKGLNFEPFTPNRPSISDACETTIGWGPRVGKTYVFGARMRQVLEVCLEEFQQHETEAKIFMSGMVLEENQAVNNKHEEDYYKRIAYKLGALWRRTVDLDHLRALVMYVVFARLFFIKATRAQNIVPFDRSVVACDAQVLLCRFLLYKEKFGQLTPNVLDWSAPEINMQMRWATEKKKTLRL
ncbi:hypothetical protein ACHAPA_006783 [Fusarium lateritium]